MKLRRLGLRSLTMGAVLAIAALAVPSSSVARADEAATDAVLATNARVEDKARPDAAGWFPTIVKSSARNAELWASLCR
jgi:hypothetical protein